MTTNTTATSDAHSQTTETAAHSHIGASSMHRWAECPGSVRLSKGIPNRSSKYAEEGTRAHEIAAQVLETGYWPAQIDDETREAVIVYVDTVMNDWEKGDLKLVEHKFNLSKVHPGLFGTADCVLYKKEAKSLHVYDYKHGAGIPVDVEKNPQLMYYGLGALMSMNLPCDTVELIIVQPRCPHSGGKVRRWKTDAMSLLDFSSDLENYAAKTEDPFAPLVPGDHCRFCPASGICPSIHAKAQELAKQEFGNDVASYDAAALSKLLHWLPMLESWIKNVREFAYSEAEHGKPIPGWKLVAKRATRKWTDVVKVGEFLEKEFHAGTVRECFETSLKSPPAIEKILAKKQFEKLSEFITAISSGNTLVEESDSRPEVKLLDAKAEFAAADEAEALLA